VASVAAGLGARRCVLATFPSPGGGYVALPLAQATRVLRQRSVAAGHPAAGSAGGAGAGSSDEGEGRGGGRGSDGARGLRAYAPFLEMLTTPGVDRRNSAKFGMRGMQG
jgi:hypothetical protein